jgi:hypothetical protein
VKTLLAAAVFFFQAGSVIAGSCRPIEYVELKDTPSKDLVSTYCMYKGLASVDQEYSKTLQGLYGDAIQKRLPKSRLESLQKDIDELSAGINECFDQRIKILSALSNRGEPAEPSCVAQKPGSSR